MLIDHHVHIGKDINKTGYSLDKTELLRRMDISGVERAVIFSCPNILPTEINPYERENEMILKVAATDSRLTPFMFIHPTRDTELYVRNIQAEFKGFKIFSSARQMEYSYLSAQDSAVFALIKTLGKPLIAHTGLKNGERGKDLINLAKDYSGKIAIAHASRLFAEDLELMQKTPNVYLDLCPLNAMLKNPSFLAVEKSRDPTIASLEPCKVINYLTSLFSRRIIWGTDLPWCENICPSGYEQEVELYKKLNLESLCSSLI